MAQLKHNRENASSGDGWTAAVGLELHVQLATATKIFCACPTRFGAPPNSQTCPICLGLPGSLPRLNRQAVALALRIGAALDCTLAPISSFDRKHYFYPDLPKNYQITQYAAPLGRGGRVLLSAGERPASVGVARLHLEEDAGRLIALDDPAHALGVDLNRAGLPLVEIVTVPELSDGRGARACLAEIRRLVVYLGACDGNLQEGSLRCDANVSVRRAAAALGPKVEIKNLNSLRAVRQAVDYEIARQTDLGRTGQIVRAETRAWDPRRRRTTVMRVKEGLDDYRYFPEPDLPPLHLSAADLAAARTALPELPAAREKRLARRFRLSPADAALMTETPALADYFEAVAACLGDGRAAAAWLGTAVRRLLHERHWRIEQFPITASRLAGLLAMIRNGELNANLAKMVQQEMLADTASAADIVRKHGWRLIADEATLQPIVARLLAEQTAAVAAFRAGKRSLLEFFVGEVMRATSGRADPEVARRLLREALADRGDPTPAN